jgi:NAD(P) transhydrogenase
MSIRHYDTLVIGSGPGGEGAAMNLAKVRQQVAVVEAYPQVGGGCTHRGTIPSKTLRHSIQLLADFRSNPLFQKTVGQLAIDYPQLLAATGAIVQQQVATRYRYYRRNKVDLIQGYARFADPHTLDVTGAAGAKETLRAEHFVIATGSRPYRPGDVDFSHPRILDSDALLSLEATPRSLTIYGAGVIGCEYASIFGNLDVKVNLVNTRDRLLSFLDDEITDALSYHLRNQGTVIRHQEEYLRVEPLSDGVVLHCKSGKKFKTDYLLWANGRTGNTDGIGLEEIGVTVNHRGQIEIDACYRTQQPHIYAVGDVVGYPGLASASYDQGRFAAAQIGQVGNDWKLAKDFPTGIYTMPEISSVGRTERELTAEKIPYEVGRAMFRSIARAQITGHTVGVLKLLFHRETLEILGIHCFGEQASEIVHIGQAIMRQPDGQNSVRYFAETTFNYPTMAEAYREAALNGLNRIF